MFTAVKLFFGTPLGKDILGITAILLLLAGVFMAGDYHGHSAGYTEGHKEGVASMQPQITELKATVAALTKKINDDTKAQNNKIEKIQTDLSNATIAAEKSKAEAKAERQAIINQYKNTTSSAVKEACAVTVDTVKVLNGLIDTQDTQPEQQP